MGDSADRSAPIAFRRADRAVFWEPDSIAVLRTEWEDRLEAISSSGERAWRAGPLERFARPPLHPVAPGVLANPRHARRDGDLLRFPGDFTVPAAPLPPAQAAPAADPAEVLGLRSRRGRWYWLTPAGEREAPDREEALALFPDLVPAGRLLVRPGAVQALVREGARGRLRLKGGGQFQADWKSLDALAAALGLPYPDLLGDLPERQQVVYARGFRDWPEEFLRMEAGPLRAALGSDVPLLVDRVLWQISRLRAQGKAADYGREARGVFYVPLVVVAHRAGVLEGGARYQPTEDERWIPEALADVWVASLPDGPAWASLPRRSDGPWSEDRLHLCLQSRLEWLVGEKQVLTYGNLEFLLPIDQVRVGEVHPHIVLVAEKTSLEEDARLVADAFGVSLVVLRGAPKWLVTEALAGVLAGKVDRPLILVSFCDFDPFGWIFPEVQARQLARYGLATERILRLVTAERFTAEEIALRALPLPTDPRLRKLVERFVQESGGIGGLPLGLYADNLRPVERVIEAFHLVTGLVRRW